jgi:hypothetical protein
METNLLILINPSLAHVYCSITLSNHGLIRLNGFVSRISLYYAMDFVISLYLIFLIGVQTFDVMGLKFSPE